MKAFRLLVAVSAAAVLFCTGARNAYAQFKSEAFQQQYNNDKGAPSDSVDKIFSFKEYFGGLSHKNEVKVGQAFLGSMIFVGGMQIYNKDYWKLPVFYSGIGVGIAGGILHSKVYDRPDLAPWAYALAGVSYWAALMDGVACYVPNDFPQPGKASLYSALLPGLGQIYNKEYWKIPIYVGGMCAAGHFIALNSKNYNRYRSIYIESDQPGYSGPITKETALYYRDVYRRYRDYSILALGIVYVLQIIDANVFAFMHDFEVRDDLALSVRPAVITPETQFAASPSASPSLGLSVGLAF